MKSYERLQSASDYLRLVTCVYQDAVAKCTADVTDRRDLMTIRSRIEHEGMSFATITLPGFARDFERALADGVIGPTLFQGFPRVGSRRRRGGIPAFLQGILGLLFDQVTGELRDENPHVSGGAESAHARLVDAVRQICRLAAKVELECTQARTQAALDSFVAVEQNLESFSLRSDDAERFRLVSHMLWDNLVVDCEVSNLVPGHGPGATAERIMGNQKFVWRRWHGRLEPYFSVIGHAYPLSIAVTAEDDEGNVHVMEDALRNVTVVPEDQEQPVRVCLVPKTLKAPRVIAIEPVCMQFVQQGIRDWLYKELERYALTAGHINFRDQTINQRLAVAASIGGQLATIDLSDASDRVPADLALSMFDGCPDLKGAIEACRSTRAELPDGRVVPSLRKFASMGSALCFPVEAMYFFTISVMALLDFRGLSWTFRNLKKVCREVYVYGDDIVVPSDAAVAVCDALQKYNCKVNANKSFWTGKFRESCGVDAYSGQVVTPVYLRKLRPRSRRQADQLISWVATAHLFYEKGYVQTAQFMLHECERVVGSLPHLPEGSPALSRGSLGYQTNWWRKGPHRWNVKYQRLEVRALVPSPVHRDDALEGYAALSKSLARLEKGGEKEESASSYPSRSPKGVLRFSSRFESGGSLHPLLVKAWMRRSLPLETDDQHLVRTALHGAVTLKRRWVPAH